MKNMEMKKGFKQTEIGVLPEEWEVVEIQNVVEITTGAKNTQDKISDGKYPFFVRSQTIERINSYSFDGEAVLTAGDGVGTGKVFHYVNGKFDFHQRVYKMSGFSKERLDGYYFYVHFSNNFYNRMMQLTAKSSVDSVRREMIAKMPIPLPPLAEQTSIATALSDMDALITQTERLIQKKKAIKQGLMQELLMPKIGWEVSTMGIVFDFKQGVQCPVEKQFYTNNIGLQRFIRIVDLTQKDEPARYILDPGISHNIKKDDLFMVRYGNPGLLGYGYEGVIANNLFRLLPKKKVNSLFFYHLLHFKNSDILSLSSSTTMAALNFTALRELSLNYPCDFEEQTRIAQILTDADNEIQALENKLNKQQAQKQGMMQVLLTGKIRLTQ